MFLDEEEFREKYEDLFEFSPTGLFVLEHTGLIQKVNSAGAKLLGVDKNSLINKSFSRYIAPDFQHEFSQYRKRLTKKLMLQTCEVKLLQRYKPLFYAQLSGKANINSRTKKIETLIMIGAISHRKQSEEPDYPQIGMSDLPIINDLNQPLAIIANYIYGCIYRLESGNFQVELLLQAMKQAEKELHRASEIVMRIKNFSCKEVFKYEPNCINAVIEEIVSLMNTEVLDYSVAIRYRPTKGLPKIMMDKMYIQQAILNLARNAIEAMQEVNISDPKLSVEINRPNKDVIEINLIDNGPGFKKDMIHKLFEPHFTTKSYGVGLGLIVSRIIVESHGGKLTVGLNPIRGACFTVSLPVSTSA